MFSNSIFQTYKQYISGMAADRMFLICCLVWRCCILHMWQKTPGDSLLKQFSAHLTKGVGQMVGAVVLSQLC